MDLSVSYIYGEAMDLAKKHGLKVMGLILINALCGIAMTLLTMPSGFFDVYMRALQGNTNAVKQLAAMNSQTNISASMAQLVISLFLSVVIYRAVVAYTRGHNMTVVEAFKVPVMMFVKYVGLMIALCVIIFLGCICLIIPGIYLGVRLIWSFYYLIENREAGIVEALKWSWYATSGRVLELVGLFFIALIGVIGVFTVIMIFVLLGCLIGTVGIVLVSLVSILLYFVCIAIIYFAQTKVYCELNR